MISTITYVGGNSSIIWEFGAGVLGFLIFVAVVSMGIEAVKRFIDVA